MKNKSNIKIRIISCIIFPAIVLNSCEKPQQTEQKKVGTEQVVNQGTATIPKMRLVASPYFSSYDKESSEDVVKMTLSKTDEDFMQIYRNFKRRNPEFANLKGNIRNSLGGLKYQIERKAALTDREKEIASELKSLLMRVRLLTSTEPYVSVKTEFARAYVDLDEMFVRPKVDEHLEAAIKVLEKVSK